jgi:hypothetical protein
MHRVSASTIRKYAASAFAEYATVTELSSTKSSAATSHMKSGHSGDRGSDDGAPILDRIRHFVSPDFEPQAIRTGRSMLTLLPQGVRTPVKLILLSTRTRPPIVLRKLAARFRASAWFAHVDVGSSKSTATVASIVRELDIVDEFTPGESMMVVIREPGVKPVVIRNLPTKYLKLSSAVKPYLMMRIPKLTPDVAYPNCYFVIPEQDRRWQRWRPDSNVDNGAQELERRVSGDRFVERALRLQQQSKVCIVLMAHSQHDAWRLLVSAGGATPQPQQAAVSFDTFNTLREGGSTSAPVRQKLYANHFPSLWLVGGESTLLHHIIQGRVMFAWLNPAEQRPFVKQFGATGRPGQLLVLDMHRQLHFLADTEVLRKSLAHLKSEQPAAPDIRQSSLALRYLVDSVATAKGSSGSWWRWKRSQRSASESWIDMTQERSWQPGIAQRFSDWLHSLSHGGGNLSIGGVGTEQILGLLAILILLFVASSIGVR